MIINCKEIRDKEIAKIKETYKGGNNEGIKKVT